MLAVLKRLGIEALPAPPGEAPAAANMLSLGRPNHRADGAGEQGPCMVVVPASCPATRAVLLQRGLSVTDVDASEAAKGDGALTCCSLRVPYAGGWAT